jgi:predicted dehydrogenase
MGTLGSSRISEPALIEPAASVPEVTVAAVAARNKSRADAFALRHGIPVAISKDDPVPTSAANAVVTMRVIDDAYRAAGLLPRPTAERG